MCQTVSGGSGPGPVLHFGCECMDSCVCFHVCVNHYSTLPLLHPVEMCFHSESVLKMFTEFLHNNNGLSRVKYGFKRLVWLADAFSYIYYVYLSVYFSLS